MGRSAAPHRRSARIPGGPRSAGAAERRPPCTANGGRSLTGGSATVRAAKAVRAPEGQRPDPGPRQAVAAVTPGPVSVLVREALAPRALVTEPWETGPAPPRELVLRPTARSRSPTGPAPAPRPGSPAPPGPRPAAVARTGVHAVPRSPSARVGGVPRRAPPRRGDAAPWAWWSWRPLLTDDRTAVRQRRRSSAAEAAARLTRCIGGPTVRLGLRLRLGLGLGLGLRLGLRL